MAGTHSSEKRKDGGKSRNLIEVMGHNIETILERSEGALARVAVFESSMEDFQKKFDDLHADMENMRDGHSLEMKVIAKLEKGQEALSKQLDAIINLLQGKEHVMFSDDNAKEIEVCWEKGADDIQTVETPLGDSVFGELSMDTDGHVQTCLPPHSECSVCDVAPIAGTFPKHQRVAIAPLCFDTIFGHKPIETGFRFSCHPKSLPCHFQPPFMKAFWPSMIVLFMLFVCRWHAPPDSCVIDGASLDCNKTFAVDRNQNGLTTDHDYDRIVLPRFVFAF